MKSASGERMTRQLGASMSAVVGVGEDRKVSAAALENGRGAFRNREAGTVTDYRHHEVPLSQSTFSY